jgi:hypothetical protein
MALKDIQTVFSVPIGFTEEQKRLFGELVIDKIRNNTAMGKDRYGGSFPKYSEAYKDSLDFENADKSTLVNLELSGDMMASMEVLATGVGTVTIGYPQGGDLAGQVEGVQKDQKRPFIGLPQFQQDLIIAKIETEGAGAKETRASVDGLVRSLLSRFG